MHFLLGCSPATLVLMLVILVVLGMVIILSWLASDIGLINLNDSLESIILLFLLHCLAYLLKHSSSGMI